MVSAFLSEEFENIREAEAFILDFLKRRIQITVFFLCDITP